MMSRACFRTVIGVNMVSSFFFSFHQFCTVFGWDHENTCFSHRMCCGLGPLISWRPITANVMTDCQRLRFQMEGVKHQNFLIWNHLQSFCRNVIPCPSLPFLDHAVYKCTRCPVWSVLSDSAFFFSFLLFMAMKKSYLSSWRSSTAVCVFSVCFPFLWWSGSGVNAFWALDRAFIRCLSTTSGQVIGGGRGYGEMTFNLHPSPGSVCVRAFVCPCQACGERCDLTAEWCAARCENWELINTLPFFTPHIRFMTFALFKGGRSEEGMVVSHQVLFSVISIVISSS